MKIGILTYHRAHNYGALLQAFGLKAYIETFGHEVEFIDYWPEYHSNAYRLIPRFRISPPLTVIKSTIKLLLSFQRSLIRRRGYLQFIQSKLEIPKRIQHSTNLSLNNLNYDLIIYGSDQIWRKQNMPGFKDYDLVYFGQHMNASNKITYAASMGIIETAEIDNMDQLLLPSTFNKISVREKDLKSFLEQSLDIHAKLVLDPVFLLSKEEWEKIAPVNKLEPYIFFYHLMPSTQAEVIVDQLEHLLNLKVYEIQKKINPVKVGERFKYQTASPTKFLELIKHADIIVSTSFHGVSFSIIFEKQFYAVGMSNNSGRVKTLLSGLGLEKRYIEPGEKIKSLTKIDYSEPTQRLNTLKVNSKQFLLPFISE